MTCFTQYCNIAALPPKDTSNSTVSCFDTLYSCTIDWEQYLHVENLETQVNGKDGRRWGTSLQAITGMKDQRQVKVTYLGYKRKGSDL